MLLTRQKEQQSPRLWMTALSPGQNRTACSSLDSALKYVQVQVRLIPERRENLRFTVLYPQLEIGWTSIAAGTWIDFL